MSRHYHSLLNILTSAAFSYAKSSYHQGEADPTPTITGTAGGTFSATPSGLSINTSTGTIDLDASTIQSYTVTYTVSGVSSSQSLAVTASPFIANNFSMDFDSASSQFIQTNYDANLIGNSPQSFSMWFKSKSTGIKFKALMGQYQENALHGWGIEIGQPSNLDKITWFSRNNSIDRTSYGSALTQNQWHHLVLVINSASLNNVNYSIYLDGTALVENATTSNYDNTSVLNSFQINNKYANQAFYGGGDFVIDEVAIWNAALSSDAVTEIYNATANNTGKVLDLNTDTGNYTSSANLQYWNRLGD